MRKIEVVAYSPAWPEAFRQEAQALQALAPEVIRAVYHIGSTSVPGLAAKPVIDVLLEVRETALLDPLAPAFVALGYEPKGEFGIPGRRYYCKGGDQRTHQIHAFASGSHDLLRHLAFRDYLIQHPAVREDYARLKVRAAALCHHDIEVYMQHKHDFIVEHQSKALAL